MKRYLLLFATVLLTACATTAGFEKKLNAWIGAEEIDLVRSWGPPLRSYETAGRKFIVYSAYREVYLPGTPPLYHTTIVGNTAYTNVTGGIPPMYMGLDCTTVFELQGTKIIAWSHQGNNCKASEK